MGCGGGKVLDISLRGQRIDERATVGARCHAGSFTTGGVGTLALAIATMLTALAGASAGGVTTGLPVVASVGDAKIGSLLLRDGERLVEAPRLATDIDVTVSGPTARA